MDLRFTIQLSRLPRGWLDNRHSGINREIVTLLSPSLERSLSYLAKSGRDQVVAIGAHDVRRISFRR